MSVPVNRLRTRTLADRSNLFFERLELRTLFNGDVGEFTGADREPTTTSREQPVLVYLQQPSRPISSFVFYGCFEPTAYPELFSQPAGRVSVNPWEIRWNHTRLDPKSERLPAGEPDELLLELRPALDYLGGSNLRLPAGEPGDLPLPNIEESIDSVLVLEFMQAEVQLQDPEVLSPSTDSEPTSGDSGSSANVLPNRLGPLLESAGAQTDLKRVAQPTLPILGNLGIGALAVDELSRSASQLPEFTQDSIDKPIPATSSNKKRDPLFELDRLLERFAEEQVQESSGAIRRYVRSNAPLQTFLPFNDEGGLIALESAGGILAYVSPFPLAGVQRNLVSSYELFQAFEVAGESSGASMRIAEPLSAEPIAEQSPSRVKEWTLGLFGITALALGLTHNRSPLNLRPRITSRKHISRIPRRSAPVFHPLGGRQSDV